LALGSQKDYTTRAPFEYFIARWSFGAAVLLAPGHAFVFVFLVVSQTDVFLVLLLVLLEWEPAAQPCALDRSARSKPGPPALKPDRATIRLGSAYADKTCVPKWFKVQGKN
jgi:hypothetical protein